MTNKEILDKVILFLETGYNIAAEREGITFYEGYAVCAAALIKNIDQWRSEQNEHNNNL